MAPKQKRPKVVGESSRASKRIRSRRAPPVEAPLAVDPPSPSANEPIAQPPSIASPRFINPDAEIKYVEGYSKRPVLCERGIQLEQFEEPPFEIMPLICAKGWQMWVKFQHKAIVPLVKEFYANVTKSRDDSGNRCLTTQVRKVNVELRPSDIAEIFQIPREEPQRAPAGSEVDLSKENLVKILTGKDNAVWLGPHLPKKGLSPKCNILHRLLCSHFIPHAFHGSVSIKQAVFIGKMILGVHIDLAKHVFDIIDSVAKTPSGLGGLPFGGLITCYILRKGVKEKTNFEVIYPMERISLKLASRSQGQFKRLSVPLLEGGGPSEGPAQEEPIQETPPSGSQPHVPSRPLEEHTLQGLFDMLRKLDEKQEAMFKEVKERQEAMFQELKDRQTVIYTGVVQLQKQYRELDSKVDGLFTSSEEETSQHEDGPTERELAEAETGIQDTMAHAQDLAPIPALTDDLPATTPEAADTEPVLDASPPVHLADPAASTPTIVPSAADNPTPEHPSDGSTEEYTSDVAPDATE